MLFCGQCDNSVEQTSQCPANEVASPTSQSRPISPGIAAACKDMPDIHLANPKAGIYEKGPGKVWPHPPLPELPQKAPPPSLIPSRRVVGMGVLSAGAGLVAAARLARAHKRRAELHKFKERENSENCICSATMYPSAGTAGVSTTIAFAVEIPHTVDSSSAEIRAITLVRTSAPEPRAPASAEPLFESSPQVSGGFSGRPAEVGAAPSPASPDEQVPHCEKICAELHAPMVGAFLLRLVRGAALRAGPETTAFQVFLIFDNHFVELLFRKEGGDYDPKVDQTISGPLLRAVSGHVASLVGSDLGSWSVTIGLGDRAPHVDKIFTSDSAEKNASLQIAEKLRESSTQDNELMKKFHVDASVEEPKGRDASGRIVILSAHGRFQPKVVEETGEEKDALEGPYPIVRREYGGLLPQPPSRQDAYTVHFRVLPHFSKSLPYMSWFSSAGIAQSLGAPSSFGGWLHEAPRSAWEAIRPGRMKRRMGDPSPGEAPGLLPGEDFRSSRPRG